MSEDMLAALDALGNGRREYLSTIDEPEFARDHSQDQQVRMADLERRANIKDATSSYGKSVQGWYDQDNFEKDPRAEQRINYLDGQSHRAQLDARMREQQALHQPRGSAKRPPVSTGGYSYAHRSGPLNARAVPRLGSSASPGRPRGGYSPKKPSRFSSENAAPDPTTSGTVRFHRDRVVSGRVTQPAGVQRTTVAGPNNREPSAQAKQDAGLFALPTGARPSTPTTSGFSSIIHPRTGSFRHVLKSGRAASQSSSCRNTKRSRPSSPIAYTDKQLRGFALKWATKPGPERDVMMRQHPERFLLLDQARKMLIEDAMENIRDPERGEVIEYYETYYDRKWIFKRSATARSIIEKGDNSEAEKFSKEDCENKYFLEAARKHYGPKASSMPQAKSGAAMPSSSTSTRSVVSPKAASSSGPLKPPMPAATSASIPEVTRKPAANAGAGESSQVNNVKKMPNPHGQSVPTVPALTKPSTGAAPEFKTLSPVVQKPASTLPTDEKARDVQKPNMADVPSMERKAAASSLVAGSSAEPTRMYGALVAIFEEPVAELANLIRLRVRVPVEPLEKLVRHWQNVPPQDLVRLMETTATRMQALSVHRVGDARLNEDGVWTVESEL